MIISLVIFLDFNRYLCLYRAITRFIKYYGKSRPDMAEGCNEKFDFNFIKWIYEYPKVKKPIILQKLKNLSKETKIYILRSPKEVELFLENISEN